MDFTSSVPDETCSLMLQRFSRRRLPVEEKFLSWPFPSFGHGFDDSIALTPLTYLNLPAKWSVLDSRWTETRSIGPKCFAINHRPILCEIFPQRNVPARCCATARYGFDQDSHASVAGRAGMVPSKTRRRGGNVPCIHKRNRERQMLPQSVPGL